MMMGVFLVVVLYAIKIKALEAKNRMAALELEKAQSEQAVRLLAAELAHLQNPERLRILAKEQLGLEPVKARQILPIEQLAQTVGLKPKVEKIAKSGQAGGERNEGGQ